MVNGARSAGYNLIAPEGGLTPSESTLSAIAAADAVIADVSERSANVFFELGFAQAMGKGILVITHEAALKDPPFDIRDVHVHREKRESSASIGDDRVFLDRVSQIPAVATSRAGSLVFFTVLH